MSLRLPLRGEFKKQQKQQVIWLEVRLQRRLQKTLNGIIVKITKIHINT